MIKNLKFFFDRNFAANSDFPIESSLKKLGLFFRLNIFFFIFPNSGFIVKRATFQKDQNYSQKKNFHY